jgi:hypothetical protein
MGRKRREGAYKRKRDQTSDHADAAVAEPKTMFDYDAVEYDPEVVRASTRK